MNNITTFIAGVAVGFIATIALAFLYVGAVYIAKRAEEEIENENNPKNYD